MSKFKPNDRVVPMKPKQKITVAKLVGFKWADRIKLLFGCNIRIEVEILTEHGPGRCMEKITVAVTPNTTKQDELRDQVVR